MKKSIDEYDGYTEFSVKNLNNRSIVDKYIFSGQSKISARMNLNNENTLCYFLITMGGGITQGEEYLTKIHLGENSRTILSTQAPTYIFKCEDGKISKQFFEINLEKNSVLEYLPDNVIPYEHSNYDQVSVVKIAKGASLIYSDGITAGWSPDGADFRYDYVHMDTQVYYDDQLMYTDNLILDPQEFDLNELGLYDQYRNYSSLIAVDEQIDEKFVHQMQKEITKDTHCNLGISKLEGPGLVVRILGENIDANRQKEFEVANYLRQKLFNSPELQLRKDATLRA